MIPQKEGRGGLIAIIADETSKSVARELYEKCLDANREAYYFCLEGMRIEPCYACRGCEEKTYGRCVTRDDADKILPYVARAKTVVIYTPIVCGGYSFRVKRLVDKFALIGDRHYYFRNGELTKGAPSGFAYFVIGTFSGANMEEAEAFKRLIKETLTLASWAGRPIVMPREADDYNAMTREVSGA